MLCRSGLMAALAAAEYLAAANEPDRAVPQADGKPDGPIKPGSVVVFEKGPRPGRKLLASGSGRCNLTHEGGIADFLGHYGGGQRPPGNPLENGNRSTGSAGRFLRKALYDFDNEALRLWLVQRGLATETDDNGKVFPVSGRATDVLTLLLREANARGIVIQVATGVERVARHKLGRDDLPQDRASQTTLSGSSDGFILTSGNSTWLAKTVILAAGGHSYPTLGSTGDSWRLAVGLGHSLVDPGPALAPAYISPYHYKSCAGISLPDSCLVIRRAGRQIAKSRGDILLTHSGLSGPGVLDGSRWMRPGDELILPLGHFNDIDQADIALQAACAANPGRQVRSLLGEMMPKRLAEVLLSLASCSPETRAAQLTRAGRLRLATGLGGEPFLVDSLGTLDEAMASRGGVSLEEVDSKSMMSRIVHGLFCAGETLDIDGDTGGYNLQAAFSTGKLAGRSAADYLASGFV